MTTVRTLAAIRADLDAARTDLEALDDGSLTWDVYDPTLRNGALQDMAIDQAARRAAELVRELAHAYATTGEK